MLLSDDEKRMLNGEHGPGTQKCMKLLVQWGELFGAEKMVRVSGSHMDPSFSDAAVEMSEGVDRARTVCTLHSAFNPKYWKEELGVVPKVKKMGGYGTTDQEEFETSVNHYRKLGFLPTFTCALYEIGFVPRAGNVLCLTGSSGQTIANTFFGARAGRETLSTSFAAAITGRTPLMGLLKKENRYPEVLVKVGDELDPSTFTEADYGALGYFIGGVVGPRNVAIEGIPEDISFKDGRMLVSPLCVSGGCVNCRIIGVSPEAPTLEVALGDKKPEAVVATKKDLEESYEKLNDAGGREVDMVVFGCPHLTMDEVGELASLLAGKKVSENVVLVAGLSRTSYALAKDCGYAQTIESAGGIFVNSCVGPMNPYIYLDDGARVAAATNSVRAAHYLQRLSGGNTKTYYGEMNKCIQAAIKGKWEN